jgi:hypothetical protein
LVTSSARISSGKVLTVKPDFIGQWTVTAFIYTPPSGGSGSGIGGSGTTNTIPRFTNSNTIGDSQLTQSPQLATGLYQMRANDMDRFIINKPSSVTSGDLEYAIQQDFDTKVSFGWDDDGDGFGFLYNWAGFGWRIGAAGNNPMLEIVTTALSESVNLHKQVKFIDYGSGNYPGTAVYSLAVDSSGNVIEEPVSTAVFTTGNSQASPNIALGASALAAAGGADGVFIGNSFGSANGSDGQINIGASNDSTGTYNISIGNGNIQTGNGAYSIALGTNNVLTGSIAVGIGRGNNLISNTFSFGTSNNSTFTGGSSTAGLMNVSIGNDNNLDIDKGIVLGFANDITGSYGWTLGAGNETVVIGSRTTMSILGPNRSSTTGPRVIIATGEFVGAGPENKKNSVEYYTPTASTSGVYHPALYNSASYADDTAAAAGGVGLGELYRNGSVVQIRMI